MTYRCSNSRRTASSSPVVVPLLPLPRLRRVRYFYVSATVRLPVFSRRLCCNEGHGLVRANRHALPAMLGQVVLQSCLRSN